MSEADVKAFVGERCEEILQEVAEILGVTSPEEVLEAVQDLSKKVKAKPAKVNPPKPSGWPPIRRGLVFLLHLPLLLGCLLKIHQANNLDHSFAEDPVEIWILGGVAGCLTLLMLHTFPGMREREP